MQIILPSTNKRFNFPFRIIGTAGRYDTLSDCKFLNDTHIVCADRQMARLYLIEIDISANNYTIKDSAECIISGAPQHFELIYVASAKVYAVSYANTLFSCDIISDKFCNMTTTVINRGDAYHGVIRLSETSVYVSNMLNPTITEYNPTTGTNRTMQCVGGTRLKDIALIDADHILIISSERGPIVGRQLPNGSVDPYNKPYTSHALTYNRHTGALIDKYVLPATQVDACIVDADYCYITCTNASGGGFILRCTISDKYKLVNPSYTHTAGFPHGICIRNGLLAYTSYADSSLMISRLSDLQFSKYPSCI
jgi:hypothetical protein